DEAMRELDAALRSPQHDEGMLVLYTYAAIAAGKTDEAHAVVDPATAHVESAPQWYAKWLLALAEKKWVAAKQLYDSETKAGVTPAAWTAGAQLLKAAGETAAYTKHLAAADRRKEL